MKNTVWFFAVLVLLCAITSCGKDDAKLEPEDITESSFSCKIDGKYWESKTVSREVMIRSQESPGVFFKTLIISGTSETEELVTLHIYNMFEAETGDCPGVYTYYGSGHEEYEEKANKVFVDGIRYGDHSAISYYSAAGTSTGSGFDDIITTITACEDYKISGTFEGTVHAQNAEGSFIVKMTEGKFENIPYVIEE